MALILRKPDVASIISTLTPSELSILKDALIAALKAFSTGAGGGSAAVQQPQRTSITTATAAATATTLFMPCSYDGTTATKTIWVPSTGPPRGIITLLSSSSGDLRAVLDAEDITGLRTALVSTILLSARRAAGLPLRAATIFGTGTQGRFAAMLLRRLFPDVAVSVVGRGTTAQVLLKALEQRRSAGWWAGCDMRGSADAGLEAVLARSDAVFCCTPATEPLFPLDWLALSAGPRSVYVSLVGSYKPHMVEVDPALLTMAGVTVVVDSADACLAEAGELVRAGLGRGDVVELGQLLAEHQPITGTCVFKCVGMGLMDLVVARELVHMAAAKGIGLAVPDF